MTGRAKPGTRAPTSAPGGSESPVITRSQEEHGLLTRTLKLTNHLARAATTRDARGVMGLCFSLMTAARGDVLSSVRVFRASRSEFNARVCASPASASSRVSPRDRTEPPEDARWPRARRGIQPSGRLASRPRRAHRYETTRARRAVRFHVPRRSVARGPPRLRSRERFGSKTRESRFGARFAQPRNETTTTHDRCECSEVLKKKSCRQTRRRTTRRAIDD